jgi:O-antigen ligase
MPRHVNVLLLLYLGVVAVATARLIVDPTRVSSTITSIISEEVINTIKWPVLGLLLFDGCRSRPRFTLGLAALLAVYFLIGLQVIRWMPANSIIAGDDLASRSLKILLNEVGYHRVNLSMMLAGAFWAMWVVSHVKIGKLSPRFMMAASIITFYAQLLTGGRLGYVTWFALGLFLSIVRWRKYLIAAPVLVPLIVFIVMAATPGVAERLLQGFSKETIDSGRPTDKRGNALAAAHDGPDMYTVTAGRTFAWPFVISKIQESPIFGHGREAMARTGLKAFLWDTYRESFPHPHNAYLEMLLDNGVIGFLLVVPFYFLMLKYSLTLFRDSSSPIFVVSGGVACALILALLVASWGSQTFYPREGSVGMWCAIGLMLRVYVERARFLAAQRRLKAGATPARLSPVENIREPLKSRQPGALLRPRSPLKQESSPDSIDGMLWVRTA